MRLITEFLSTKVVQTKIKATDDTIHKTVKDELDRLGHNADLNHIDTSEVTDMNHLFNCDDFYLGSKYEDLNPDISKWNVLNVKDMSYMFCFCKNFNQDLSQWNVSKVKNMAYMFEYCENFNKDLSRWDVGKVEDMYAMFNGCINFNQDLSQWDVGKVEDARFIFYRCPIKKEFKPKFKI